MITALFLSIGISSGLVVMVAVLLIVPAVFAVAAVATGDDFAIAVATIAAAPASTASAAAVDPVGGISVAVEAAV